MIVDDWIHNNSRIPAEKLHALGVISLNWNTAEMSLFWLFCTVSGLGGVRARMLVYDIGIPILARKIIPLAKTQKQISPELLKRIEFAIGAFGVCRSNRIQLAHFIPSGAAGGIEFLRNKGAGYDWDPIPNDLQTLLRVADDIRQTSALIASIGNYLSEMHSNPLRHLESPRQEKLPDLFPMPVKIMASVG